MTMTVNMTYHRHRPEGAAAGSITLPGDQSQQTLGRELAIDLENGEVVIDAVSIRVIATMLAMRSSTCRVLQALQALPVFITGIGDPCSSRCTSWFGSRQPVLPRAAI